MGTADTCVNGVCSSVLDCSICGGGATSVLELTTDNYPAETSWDIKNSSGDEQYEGSGYSEADTLHTINMCLASDEYTFKINDAYGDGICCSYGEGGYKITVDGTEVVSGGTFGNSETKTFTVTASPTSPVSPPTSPVSPPTSPVSPPTPGPTTTSPVSPRQELPQHLTRQKLHQLLIPLKHHPHHILHMPLLHHTLLLHLEIFLPLLIQQIKHQPLILLGKHQLHGQLTLHQHLILLVCDVIRF